MEGHRGNYSKFLTFVRIFVDETNESNPITIRKLFKRMEDYGYTMRYKQFNSYIRCMKEAGIIINYTEGLPRHYWYENGWI